LINIGNMDTHVARIARLGYAVAAPNFFHRSERPVVLASAPEGRTRGFALIGTLTRQGVLDLAVTIALYAGWLTGTDMPVSTPEPGGKGSLAGLRYGYSSSCDWPPATWDGPPAPRIVDKIAAAWPKLLRVPAAPMVWGAVAELFVTLMAYCESWPQSFSRLSSLAGSPFWT
jgi:hypothetical protein